MSDACINIQNMPTKTFTKCGALTLYLWHEWVDLSGADTGILWSTNTVYPKKYAHGYCFAVLCCGYTLTDFPISIRLTSLALWQYNDCPSASKATLMNMDKYCMWIHYERLHNHNKANHNKTVCIFFGIYCMVAVDAMVSVVGIKLAAISITFFDKRIHVVLMERFEQCVSFIPVCWKLHEMEIQNKSELST